MENDNEQAGIRGTETPERPDFLKIICILSFVGCGLMILGLSFGSLCLALPQSTVDEIWPQVVQSNPTLEEIDGLEFFRQLGWMCVYGLFANIFSLIGVIMMWRLEKVGFYIYAAAELIGNFVGMGFDMGQQQKSYGGTIFFIVIDLVFIGMYFVNLKYMKGSAKAN